VVRTGFDPNRKKAHKVTEDALPPMPPALAAKLIERIATIPLYAHAYAFHLNFRFGTFGPFDLLDFAAANRLRGAKIHMEDGEERSLGKADMAGLAKFGHRARQLGLDLNLEISQTDVPALQEAVRVGRAIGATSIRCYPRYEGRVSSVIKRTIADLQSLAILDPQGDFRFTLEQHEDLKAAELVHIVEAVGNPRLSLLFDFTNMINALERPIAALQSMAGHVTDVHIKDAKIIAANGGWGQLCCRSGEGDIPQARLLMELLCLGANLPQVVAYGLEEEVGYASPPFRFAGEEDDPCIAFRKASETDLTEGIDLATQLAVERANAQHLCGHVALLLKKLHDHAVLYL